MLRINLSAQAMRFLDDLQQTQAGQIVKRIDALAQYPDSVPSEILRGGQGERRLKSGEFRVILEIHDDELAVILIDRRNDDRIYRRFRRR